MLESVLEEKEYYDAYKRASAEGTVPNAFTRIILAGPPNVGKTSIRKIFTESILDDDSPPTKVADIPDKMVDITAYEILEYRKCDFRKVVNNIIIATIKKYLQQNQQTNVEINNLSQDQSNNELIASTTSIESYSLPYSNDKAISTTDSEMEIADWKPELHFSQMYQQLALKLNDKSNTSEQKYGGKYGILLDFGGQPIYHIAHRPFMSVNGIYILVFDINQDINQPVKTRDGKPICMTYLDIMQEWLISIIEGNTRPGHSEDNLNDKKSDYSLPVIILVASHGDLIENKQERKDKFQKFEESLMSNFKKYKSNIYSSQIIFNCNAEDQSQETIKDRQECCKELNQIILKFVESMPSMLFTKDDKGIPIIWYIIAVILHTGIDDSNNQDIANLKEILRDNKIPKATKIMEWNDVQKLLISCGLYNRNSNDDDLRKILSYLHDIGEIIYCDMTDKGRIIITDVNWFLKIMRGIIQLHDSKSSIKAARLDIKSDYKEAYKTGKMSKGYLDYILTNNQVEKEEQKKVLQLLEHYDIICKIKSKNDTNIKYFVPYLLDPEIQELHSSDYYTSEKLYIGYRNHEFPCIPDGIFYCLLTSCLKEWNDDDWNDDDLEIHHQCVRYYLTKDEHYIIIKKEKSHISLQYCYEKSQNTQGIFANIENSIYVNQPHKKIQNKLREISQGKMPKYKDLCCQFYVKCEKCQPVKFIEVKDDSRSHSGNSSRPKNNIRCPKCKKTRSYQSIDDWMIYERISLQCKSTNPYMSVLYFEQNIWISCLTASINIIRIHIY